MDELLEILKNGGIEGDTLEDLNSKLSERVIALIDEKTKGLLTNRDELKEEKKALKEKYDELSEKIKTFEDNEITIEKYREISKELETLRESTGGDVSAAELQEKLNAQFTKGKKEREEELQPTINGFKGQIDNLKLENERITGSYINYRAHSAVQDAINEMKLNVDPYWVKGLMADAKISYDKDTDKLDIQLPSKGMMLPINDWKENFVTSEEGKRLLAPRGNFGGGAGGSTSTNKKLTLQEIEQIDDPVKMEQALKENGYLTD